MRLNAIQTLIILLAITVGTVITRFLPPILFPHGKPLPKFLQELCTLLPPAMMGLLLVYSLRNVSFASAGQWLPECIAIAVTAGLHLWRRWIRCRSTRCTAASVTSPADAPLSKSVTGWPPAASATRSWCSLHRPAGQPSAAAGGGGSMPGCGTLRRSMIPMPCDALSFQVYQVISHDGRYPP